MDRRQFIRATGAAVAAPFAGNLYHLQLMRPPCGQG